MSFKLVGSGGAGGSDCVGGADAGGASFGATLGRSFACVRLIGAIVVQNKLPAGDPCWIAARIGEYVGHPRSVWFSCRACTEAVSIDDVYSCGACSQPFCLGDVYSCGTCEKAFCLGDVYSCCTCHKAFCLSDVCACYVCLKPSC